MANNAVIVVKCYNIFSFSLSLNAETFWIIQNNADKPSGTIMLLIVSYSAAFSIQYKWLFPAAPGIFPRLLVTRGMDLQDLHPPYFRCHSTLLIIMGLRQNIFIWIKC